MNIKGILMAVFTIVGAVTVVMFIAGKVGYDLKSKISSLPVIGQLW